MRHTSTQFKQARDSGFTLVETLVAITILLIVIIGPLSISSQSARSTSFASEQVVAYFLAQEGLEMVRKLRDDRVLTSFVDPDDSIDAEQVWVDFMNEVSNCVSTNGCGLSFDENNLGSINVTEPCATEAANCPLWFDDRATSTLRSRYTHSNPGAFVATPYRRSIRITEPNPGEEIRIESTVYWRTSDQRDIQSVSAETYLFNIYD